MSKHLNWILVSMVFLLLVFQVGHFAEHVFQFGYWLLVAKDSMFMTGWATFLVETLAEQSNVQGSVQARLIGIEMLHLIGNTIFLLGLAALRIFNSSKYLSYALTFQVIHVLEHIILTVTMLVLGLPLGFTTLFGKETTVVFMIGWRIIFHFILNLVPSVFAVLCVRQMIKERKKRAREGVVEIKNFYE